jgi:hypothetical protein
MDENSIQRSLEALSRKIDDLTVSLPNTYVPVKSHDLQMKSHDEKLISIFSRLEALERLRIDGRAWADKEHDTMQKEWKDNLKEVSGLLSSVDRTVLQLSGHFSLLLKVLVWVLGIFTTIGIAVIIAWLTQR